MSNWGPATAITLEEHDALMANRRRPLTQGPMRRARVPDDDSTSSPSLIDTYIQPKGDQ